MLSRLGKSNPGPPRNGQTLSNWRPRMPTSDQILHAISHLHRHLVPNPIGWGLSKNKSSAQQGIKQAVTFTFPSPEWRLVYSNPKQSQTLLVGFFPVLRGKWCTRMHMLNWGTPTFLSCHNIAKQHWAPPCQRHATWAPARMTRAAALALGTRMSVFTSTRIHQVVSFLEGKKQDETHEPHTYDKEPRNQSYERRRREFKVWSRKWKVWSVDCGA